MAKSNIASVLAFEKKLVPSDGFMYGTTWKEGREADAIRRNKEKWAEFKEKQKNKKEEDRKKLVFPTPLKLQEKSVESKNYKNITELKNELMPLIKKMEKLYEHSLWTKFRLKLKKWLKKKYLYITSIV